MTNKHHTTMRDREIGWRLRKAMNAAGLNGQDMADRMHVHPTQISRMLTGGRTSKPTELAVWLAVCGIAHGADREQILALSQQDPNVVRLVGAQRWTSLREHIDQAREVAEVAPAMVPWAMQAPAYAHALAETLGVSADASAVWSDYLGRLYGDNLNTVWSIRRWSVVLHEHVLRTVVGDHAVMSEQLSTLLLWAEHPAVSVRVVPAGAGAHAGMSGGFTLLEFSDLPAVVYREEPHVGVFVSLPDTAARAAAALTSLHRQALDTQDSQLLIQDLANEYNAGPLAGFIDAETWRRPPAGTPDRTVGV